MKTATLSKRNKTGLIIALIAMVLLLDQSLKFWIKTNLMLGESIYIFDWFQLHFVENNGMAFGMEIVGKLFLSIFRIIAIGFIIYFLHRLIKLGYRLGFIICVGLILAGAIGNLIDSAFYGLIFNGSEGQVATFLHHPNGEPGYAPFLYGKVVDMFYFPIIKNSIGNTLFFSPVFNVADAAVTTGVFIILLFYRKDLNDSLETKKESDEA